MYDVINWNQISIYRCVLQRQLSIKDQGQLASFGPCAVHYHAHLCPTFYTVTHAVASCAKRRDRIHTALTELETNVRRNYFLSSDNPDRQYFSATASK